MAQIPTGNFGRRIAGAGPVAQVNRQDPLAEATGRTLGVAVDAANENTVMQTRLDLQARDEYDRQQQEAKAAADRVKQLVAMQDAETALDDVVTRVGTGIQDRSLDRDKAEGLFMSEAAKVIDGAGQGLDDTVRPLLQAQLRGKMLKATGTIKEAALQRDRADVTAGISQVAEFTQRLYRTDPAKATAQMMATIEQLGPHSDMSPAKLSALRQTWNEGVQYSSAYEQIVNAGDSLEALGKARKYLDTQDQIDPQKRNQLENMVSLRETAALNKANAEAERRARERQRLETRAEQAWRQGLDLSQYGILSPETGDRLLKEMAGTSFAQSFQALLQTQRETGPVALMPTKTVQAQLDAVNQRMVTEGVSEGLIQQQKRLEKVIEGQRSDMNQEGDLRAWGKRGVGLPPEIDVLRSDLGSVADQIAARANVHEAITLRKGAPAQVLYPQEAELLVRQLRSMPAQDQADAVALMASRMPARLATAVGMQLAQGSESLKDRALGFALRMGSRQTTGIDGKGSTPRYVSELMLRGADSLASGKGTKGAENTPEASPNKWPAQIANYLDGTFTTEQATKDVVDAATLVAHGIAAEQGGKLDADDLKRAVRIALGGTLVARGRPIQRNGRTENAQIPLPAGFTEDDLDKRLESLRASDLGAPEVVAGGRVMPAEQVLPLIRNAPLSPVADGVYAPLINGRTMFTPSGNLVTIRIR